tara:strand:+ start:1482 stop:1733 length:252 start_codon:yes stop_codon:yes gene_type:complete
MRHYVQIVEPMGLPLFVDGMFVEDELIECRAHPIVEGKMQRGLEFEKDEPLLLAIANLLIVTYDASRQVGETFRGPDDRCRQN